MSAAYVWFLCANCTTICFVGQYGGSLAQVGDCSSSGELEAGELIIDDSYTQLSSKKKKKSKKSKKKKDKVKDRDKSSKEKKHNKGGNAEKKGFKGKSEYQQLKKIVVC